MYILAMADNVLGICEVCDRREQIWESGSEPHILLLADLSEAKARKPKASEEFGGSPQY